MDWLKIDDWWEMLVAGLVSGGTILSVLWMVLAFLDRRKGKIKAGPVEIGGNLSDSTPSCTPYVAEHSEILDRLTEAIEELRDLARIQAETTRGVDVMQRAELEALEVLLGIAEGEEKNGQIGRARTNLARAQGYKDATAEATKESDT